MSNRTANDKAWGRYFNETDNLEKIEKQGYFYVTAKDLKKLGEREPRLMAKLDTSNERPKVFKKNDLTIFPVKNGKYVVFEDPNLKSYFELGDKLSALELTEYNSDLNLKKFDTYPKEQNLSESQAIDFSFVSSLFSQFTGDNNLNLTIRGRLFSNKFSFSLPNNNHKVDVSGVQIEVDSGYESKDGIYIVEAKVGRREDFNIRQLYYPYLEWKQKTTKQVVPIFFTFTNGKYYLTQFSFSENFGELSIVKSKGFTINEEPKPVVELSKMVEADRDRREPSADIPYPQANDLDKVVDLVHLINKEKRDRYEIATYFEFDKRQGNYYGDAARYLGLIKKAKKGSSFSLSDKGRKFINLNTRAKKINFLVEQMVTKQSFHQVLKLFIDKGLEIDKIKAGEVASVIRDHRDEINQTTAKRRATTVKAWLKWIKNNCEIK